MNSIQDYANAFRGRPAGKSARWFLESFAGFKPADEAENEVAVADLSRALEGWKEANAAPGSYYIFVDDKGMLRDWHLNHAKEVQLFWTRTTKKAFKFRELGEAEAISDKYLSTIHHAILHVTATR